MNNTVKFRDPFLDLLKGLAILLVIFEHSFNEEIIIKVQHYLPIQAVPIFMLITLYLSFDKLSRYRETDIYDEWYNVKRLKSLWTNLLLPFLLITVIAIAIVVIYDCIAHKEFSIFLSAIKMGGVGPGSYYIWVYIQIWVLIPLSFKFLKTKGIFAMIAILTFCVFLNILLSCINISDSVYRLLCVRYLFLTVVAYVWLNLHLYNRKIIGLLVVLSALYLIFFRKYDLTPFIYNGGWDVQNYPGYFFSLGVILIVRYLFRLTNQLSIYKAIYWCGENSWYLFLAQLFIIFLFNPKRLITILDINGIVLDGLYCIIVFILSISSVFIYRKIKNHVRLQ